MQVFLLLLKLALRNVWRNPRRSLITLFAIVMGVWSSAMLSTLARGISWGMAEDSIRNLTGHIEIHDPEYLKDPVLDHSIDPPSDDLQRKLSSDQIAKWTTRIRVPGVVMSERESFGVTIVGIDPGEEAGLSFIGDGVSSGTSLESPSDTGVIVGRRLLDLLQSDLGKRIVLMSETSQHQLGERGFRIRGVYTAKLQATEQSYVFVGRATLQEMLKLGSRVSEITILAKDKEAIDSIKQNLVGSVNGLVVSTWRELSPFVSALLEIQNKFIGFWFIIVFIAVSFGIVNTLLMAIFERTREIGMLQALGMKPSLILYQVILETLYLVVVGTVAGNVLAYLSVHALSGGVDVGIFAKGAEYVGASRIVYPTILQRDWIQINVTVFAMGTLSSIYPAWRAARLRPVQALQRG